MQVVHERCCGLDLHKRSVVACVLSPSGRQTRTFGTTTDQVLALADWLVAEGVTHAAMESSGVYWRPIYNVLEGTELVLLVANAQHIKAVPGRKTDVKDAEWIADLLRHGLLKASFVPERAQRELRDLVRYRTALSRNRAQVGHRIEKTLEAANIKLGAVATDLLGQSGRAMLAALAAGEEDPEGLANLARGRLQRKHAERCSARQGVVGAHQRLVLQSHLRHLAFLDEEIERLSAEVTDRLQSHQDALERLDTIPGVGPRVAEALLAEVGADVARFPSAAHLASWARVCPGMEERAGKRRSGHIGPGNPGVRGILVEAAWAASHTKDTYLAAQYRRLVARRGVKRALVALAHTILVIVYQLLRRQTTYTDLGGNYFDERRREAAVHHSVQRLERLGYHVQLQAT
jgi:transposase